MNSDFLKIPPAQASAKDYGILSAIIIVGQVNQRLVEMGEGTGLGLSISKGILGEHMASIAVLNDSVNTTFEIRFQKVELLNASAN